MSRIVITGGPRTGKTTLATHLSTHLRAPVAHTDSITNVGWSQASLTVAAWFTGPEAGPWIVEGVVAPRALRKWLAHHDTGTPCDVVYWLAKPFVELSKGQLAMTVGIETVFSQIEKELIRRNVEVRRVLDVTLTA